MTVTCSWHGDFKWDKVQEKGTVPHFGKALLTDRLITFGAWRATKTVLELLGFGIGRQKLAILLIWFASLIAIRLLLGLVLSNMWIGTVGAVGITFGLFYFVLTRTPLRKYRFAVGQILQDWYKKKYLLYSVGLSASIILGLIVLIEYGYANHPSEIVSLREITTIRGAQDHVNESVRQLTLRGYSVFDAASITAASVDKSLQGFYLKSASFVLAEHLEIMVFMLLARKSATLFS